jgi:hypothetical protein
MDPPTDDCARAVRRAFGLTAALVLAVPALAAEPGRWDVTVAVRISGGTGAPMAVRLALPPDSDRQRISGVEITSRGLKATVVRDGDEPHVLWQGKLKGARRVAVRYTVERTRPLAAMPAVEPLDVPSPALLPFLTPSPLFQSRSLLVREFLETNVTPVLSGDNYGDLMRAVYRVTRARLEWRADGKTHTLDVIRSGGGKRIGIERVFTTFLRCAHVPARFVEGMNLNSSTGRKRVFWTEVWTHDRWWPVSASAGWIGRAPKSYVALTRDGQRVLRVEGPVQASYSVQAVRLEGKA